MKLTLHENLVITIDPETRADQALINHMAKMDIGLNGFRIKNAGMDWDTGRRESMSLVFRHWKPPKHAWWKKMFKWPNKQHEVRYE